MFTLKPTIYPDSNTNLHARPVTPTGADLLTLRGHENEVWSVAFSRDDRLIASGSWDKTVKVWDSALGADILSLKARNSVAFSPDGPNLSPQVLRALRDGKDVRLIRRNPKYDLWAEDAARRKVWDPIYHARDAQIAESKADWFAAEFHLRHLLQAEPENQDLKSRHERAVQELERSNAVANSLPNQASTPNPAVAEKPE